MNVRVLIDSAISGRLIGKSGVTVKSLRESSSAWIDISNSVRGANKRIVTVKGNVDTITNAFSMMADCLADKQITDNKNQISQNEGETSLQTVNIVLLVHNAQVGCIIGKGGQTVRETRENSGAQVNVSEHMLEQSMEKSVTVKGLSSNVRKALSLIVHHLAARQDRASTHNLYTPRPAYDTSFVDPSYGTLPYYYPPSQSPTSPVLAQYGYQPPASLQTIIVPVQDHMIGCVIGKRGATIRDIRQRSRAQITIADPQPESTDRMITITGTRQANDLAVAFIYEKMAAFDPNKHNNRQNRNSSQETINNNPNNNIPQ